MMIFVFAHRHSKGDRFIVETQQALEARKNPDLHFDFTIVRNVMYMYSKKAQEHYFNYPVESFLMAHFAASSDGQDFIRSKPDHSEKHAKTQRILHDTEELRQQAVLALESGLGQKKLT